MQSWDARIACVVLCNKHAQDLHSNISVATSGRWNSFSSHSFQYICFWLDFLGYSLLCQWLVLVPCLLHEFSWSSKVVCFYKLLLCINPLHEGWQRTWISEKPLNKVVSLWIVSFWEMIFFLFPTFFNFLSEFKLTYSPKCRRYTNRKDLPSTNLFLH